MKPERMSREDYLQDAARFASRGESRHNAVLNENVVRWIRRNRHGFTAKLQAALIGCHWRTVEKVRALETWVHVR
jgi:hypothetical protein